MKINPGVGGMRRDGGSGPEYWCGEEIPEEGWILKGRQKTGFTSPSAAAWWCRLTSDTADWRAREGLSHDRMQARLNECTLGPIGWIWNKETVRTAVETMQSPLLDTLHMSIIVFIYILLSLTWNVTVTQAWPRKQWLNALINIKMTTMHPWLILQPLQTVYRQQQWQVATSSLDQTTVYTHTVL